jgi:DNA-binding MarR family transcriptional regulator
MTRRSAARHAPASSTGESTVAVFPLRCTGASVRRLARRITSFYEQRMPGLKLSQYSVLQHLSEEPQSLLQLSRRLEMDRTTLTRNLKPLIANGWVGETSGDDARRRLVLLTPAGLRLRRRAHEDWKTAQRALDKELGHDFIAALHRQLDTALARLKPTLPDEN